MQFRNAGDEIGDIIVGRGGDNLFGRADLDERAVFHNRDAVADADGLVQIVGDENRGLAHFLRQREELILQLAANERIERRKRLVHQQNVRIGGERPRQPDSLLHAARKFVRIGMLPTRQIDRRQRAVGGFGSLFFFDAADLERQGDIFARVAVRQQRHILKNHSDFARAQGAQIARRQIADVFAFDQNLARGRLDQAVDVADESRFARPGQSHHAKNLAFGDLERSVGDSDHAIELFLDFALFASRARRRQRLGRFGAENFPQAATTNDGRRSRIRISHLAAIIPRAAAINRQTKTAQKRPASKPPSTH